MGARRSHPPTLIKLVERALRDECSLENRDGIVVAVSGGGDSQALLHVLALLREKIGFELHAHGVDHGLRPEAAAELELAEALARELDVPYAMTRLRVAPGGNLMARARDERYRALGRARSKAGATLIATAHHADDRAETVIERLLRGAGPRGLAVLPARSDDLVRPMIRARRTDVALHLQRHRIAHASDPTNQDRRFLRARIRHELLPLLESLSPQVVQHLTALADQLGREPPPAVMDEAGNPLRLNRAQTAGIERLLKNRSRSAEVRLSGGRVIRWDAQSGRPVVGRGDAKRGKSD